jgi:hypothetical protein
VRGLDPADPSELGEIVASRESPSMIAFRHRSHHFVKPLVVDQETVLSLVTGAASRYLTFPGGRSQSIDFS